MTDADRIARLESIVGRLLGSMLRKDTLQDGNWGWPSHRQELKALELELIPKGLLSAMPQPQNRITEEK